ncbi:uncharacterized protein DDB_G0290685-like isoform X1 [Cloeon dipterum]|uniref:uncharacterized protein DDB_G0290685-like isoform X1 n=1 Tax=Cloeon dipterum TaxID=197152 RepID=UPI003220278B
MERSFLILVMASLIAMELGVHAGKSDGRWKYIKKPASKNKVKTSSEVTTTSSDDQDEKRAEDMLDENEESPQPESGDGDIGGENSGNAVGEPVENPASGIETAVSGDENGNSENKDPASGDENTVSVASGDENPAPVNGNAASGDENPASGDEAAVDSSADGQADHGASNNPDSNRESDNNGGENPEGDNPHSASTKFSLTDEEEPIGSTTPKLTALYTNELGEPVTNYKPTPKIYKMRRTSTTIINGRRIKIVNNRRGWNRQTILHSGD